MTGPAAALVKPHLLVALGTAAKAAAADLFRSRSCLHAPSCLESSSRVWRHDRLQSDARQRYLSQPCLKSLRFWSIQKYIPQYFSRHFMCEDVCREEVISTIDRAVEELLKGAGIASAPVDVIELAQKHLGIVVCLDSEQPQRGRAQRAAGQKQIFLRPEPTQERHQWTVAHETGEHLKATLLSRLGMEPSGTLPMAGESLANLFAYRLLVPTCWFKSDASEADFDLLALKQRYRTASHEVIAWRFLDLPEPCIVTIVDNG